MGTLQISTRVSSFSYCHTRKFSVRNKVQKIQVTKMSTPRLPNRSLVAELNYLKNYTLVNTINNNSSRSTPNSMELVKLHLILEIVAERLEMHKNVGIQRDNWNHLLLSSVNMMTLSAASMAGLAAVTASNNGVMAPLVAMKVSSTILYMAATGLLVFMNKVQPSQLAEEQRNATRLFKQLLGELKTLISLGNVNEVDVNEAMEKVLALDKAYPLPLLGTMLEKFPKVVKPAIWWPQRKQRYQKQQEGLLGAKLKNEYNGWDSKLEEEMKKIVVVLKKKDKEDYLRLGKLVLNLNKVLAISGPILTGLGALGSCFLGSVNGSWPVMFGVICGALASVVNTVEHGGQVGMVFELYRGTSGFFKLLEETIEVNLSEEDYLKRENGELFEIKVAMKLGRSVSELRQFSAGVSLLDDENDSCEEFASKLF